MAVEFLGLQNYERKLRMDSEAISMTDSSISTNSEYQALLANIAAVYATGRSQAQQAVNLVLVETYWQIGCDIVEFEQGGKVRAEYGQGLLAS